MAKSKEKPRERMFGIRMNEELRRQLTELAKKDQRPVSIYARIVLQQHVESAKSAAA